MNLPESILYCMQALEDAGFAAYAVGGCVRDACLGITPHDYDLCTSARPEEMEAVFADHKLVLSGKKHGTVGVVTESGVVEITTFRTEGAYLDNRHPAWVSFVSCIEEDLARRDFTVNAMAYSPTRGFADPFGGREDLKNRVLRAVGNPVQRFQEDALRILRGARFAVRFRLTVETETGKAMEELAPLLDHLSRERVFEELCKLLQLANPDDLCQFAQVLAHAIPELAPMIGFDQKTRHHRFDLFTHTAYVTGGVPAQLPLRWAALLHDTGKVSTFTLDESGQGHFYGHAKVSAQLADAILLRLKAPNELRKRVVLLIEQHMTPLLPEKKLLRRRLSQYGPEAVSQLLLLQQADCAGTGVSENQAHFAEIRRILEEIQEEDACLSLKSLAVNGHDLKELGYRGPEIGKALNCLLEAVLDEKLPNEKSALLEAITHNEVD